MPRRVVRKPDEAETARLIAEYIEKHGVTVCPAAALEPTQGEISVEDRERHRARGDDPTGHVWRNMNQSDRHRLAVKKYWAMRDTKRKAGL